MYLQNSASQSKKNTGDVALFFYSILEHMFPERKFFLGKYTIIRDFAKEAHYGISEYQLLEISEEEDVNEDRRKALEWLDDNQDPPELLIKKLREHPIDEMKRITVH